MSISNWAAAFGLLACISPTSAEDKLIQKTYPVADLIVPLHNAPGVERSALPMPMVPSKVPASGTREAELLASIKQAVAPKTWSGQGGHGTVEYYPLGMAIVVEQKAEVHEQLQRFLKALSKEMDREVAVEFSVVTMPKALWENWLLQRSIGDQGKWYWHKRLTMSDKELQQFMAAVKSNELSSCVQFPKLTEFNGQNCSLQAGEKLQLRVHSRLGDDCKSVALSFQFKSPAGSIDDVVVATSGQTTLLGGWCTDPMAMRKIPPQISNIPYLSRLFKDTPQVSFVLITPRLITAIEATSTGHSVIDRALSLMASTINGIADAPRVLLQTCTPTMKLTLKVGIGDSKAADSGVIQVGGIILDGEIQPIDGKKPQDK